MLHDPKNRLAFMYYCLNELSAGEFEGLKMEAMEWVPILSVNWERLDCKIKLIKALRQHFQDSSLMECKLIADGLHDDNGWNMYPLLPHTYDIGDLIKIFEERGIDYMYQPTPKLGSDPALKSQFRLGRESFREDVYRILERGQDYYDDAQRHENSFALGGVKIQVSALPTRESLR